SDNQFATHASSQGDISRPGSPKVLYIKTTSWRPVMNVSLTSNETTVQQVKLLINGEWVESQTTEWHDIVNPATQQVLAKVPFATAQEVDAAISAAHQAFQTWKLTPIGARM